MKINTIFAWSIWLLAFTLPATAQKHKPEKTPLEDIARSVFKQSGRLLQPTPGWAQKTTGTGSRLISYSRATGSAAGGAYENYDSSAYHYPNTMTGNPDLRTDFRWTGSTYGEQYRYLMSYDAQGHLSQEIEHSWDGAGWLNTSNAGYSYDSRGNISQMLFQRWYSGAWMNISKSTITYNASDKPTQMLVEQWDSNTSTWLKGARYNLSYDAAGNNTVYQVESWDAGTSQWLPLIRFLDRFNASNHKISSVFQVSGASGAWENSDSNSFNPLNGAGFPLVSTSYLWFGSMWELTQRETYGYTATNMERSYLREAWNGTSFTIGDRRFSSYNSFDQLSSVYTESNDGAGGWAITYNDYMDRYHYEAFTTTGIAESLTAVTAKLYPNPAGAELFLTFSAAPKTQLLATFYSSTGQLVRTEVLTARPKVNLDISRLSPGSYILGVQQTGSVEYLPFVKR